MPSRASLMARSRWSPPMVALSQRRSSRRITVFGPIATVAVVLLGGGALQCDGGYVLGST
eukprot:3526628-Pyramimonas_sp.AAC.1